MDTAREGTFFVPPEGVVRKQGDQEVTVLVSPLRAVESLQKKDARPGVWGKRLSRSLLSYAPGRLALYQREVGMCD